MGRKESMLTARMPTEFREHQERRSIRDHEPETGAQEGTPCLLVVLLLSIVALFMAVSKLATTLN